MSRSRSAPPIAARARRPPGESAVSATVTIGLLSGPQPVDEIVVGADAGVHPADLGPALEPFDVLEDELGPRRIAAASLVVGDLEAEQAVGGAQIAGHRDLLALGLKAQEVKAPAVAELRTDRPEERRVVIERAQSGAVTTLPARCLELEEVLDGRGVLGPIDELERAPARPPAACAFARGRAGASP